MAYRLNWDAEGERMFETGTDHGVLYVKDSAGKYKTGVVWNGLTAVTSSPSGAESSDQWADNMKYFSLLSAEDYGFTIEAFSSPVEFDECDGTSSLDEDGILIASQQDRTGFGFSWRTLIGNDVAKTEYGYKIHLVYNATAGVSERAYATVNDSPEAINLSWECSTIPINVPGKKPAAHFEFDMSRANEKQRAAIEAILYGYEGEDNLPFELPEGEVFTAWKQKKEPTLLLPQEFAAVLAANKVGIGG